MNNLKQYAQWLKNKNLSPKTLEVYQRIIGYYGNNPLATKNITQFVKKIIKRLDPSTCQLYLAVLISYSKFRRVNEEIDWARINQLIPTKLKKFYTTISQEELIKLKSVRFEKDAWKYQRNNLMLEFLFYGGLRVSELVNIRHRDWEGNSLRIHGKGNKVRYAFLPDFLVKCFRPSSRGYLFTDHQGQKISTSRVRGIILEKTQLAGINRKVSPHTFRRSLATNLYNRGGRLETIQKQLGHSNIQTTLGYIHNDYNTLYQDYSKLFTEQLGGSHA